MMVDYTIGYTVASSMGTKVDWLQLVYRRASEEIRITRGIKFRSRFESLWIKPDKASTHIEADRARQLPTG